MSLTRQLLRGAGYVLLTVLLYPIALIVYLLWLLYVP